MKKLVFALISVSVLLLIILYLTGVFESGRIHPGDKPQLAKTAFSGPELTVRAKEVDEYYLGVGTVTSQTQSIISGQVNGTVMEVFVRDGDQVTAKQVLMKVDDREYLTMLREAEKGLEMAKNGKQQAGWMLLQAQAQYQQALAGKRLAEQGKAQSEQGLIVALENLRRSEADFKRMEQLSKTGNASEQQFDAAKASYVAASGSAEQAKIAVSSAAAGIDQADEAVKAVEAGVAQAKMGIENAELSIQRAEEILERTRISLSYTEVKAPADGFIGQTFADPGDLIFPGKPLVDFYSRGDNEVVTYARESLFRKVKRGDTYDVTIDAVALKLRGVVKEIVPSADPASRTFMIRLSIGANDQIFPGMFARVAIPVYKKMAIFVPPSAVKRIGMLTTVTVKEDNFAILRYVKLGRENGNVIEVISGLSDGDVISAGGAR